MAMKIINLFGGPGCGKTTTALDLVSRMKKDGYKVEYADEYAKDKVYEEEHNKLSDQLYILAKQHRKIRKLHGKVDYVVTDSPFLLGIVYNKFRFEKIIQNNLDEISYHKDIFPNLIWDMWSQYINISFYIERNSRVTPYQTFGRYQNEQEAQLVDRCVRETLTEKGRPIGKLYSIPMQDNFIQKLIAILIKDGHI